MATITSKTERFTVNEYLKMDRAGVFDDQNVELVLGRIVKMHSQANAHIWAVTKCASQLLARFPLSSHWVVVQGTLRLGKYGAPDPDLHLFDVPAGTEDSRLPKPLLVIEVSDSTYRKDSGIKVIQYASAGIADYWLLNLQAKRIEVRREPSRIAGPSGRWGYAETLHYLPGQSVSLLARPDVEFQVTDLLP